MKIPFLVTKRENEEPAFELWFGTDTVKDARENSSFSDEEVIAFGYVELENGHGRLLTTLCDMTDIHTFRADQIRDSLSKLATTAFEAGRRLGQKEAKSTSEAVA